MNKYLTYSCKFTDNNNLCAFCTGFLHYNYCIYLTLWQTIKEKKKEKRTFLTFVFVFKFPIQNAFVYCAEFVHAFVIL